MALQVDWSGIVSNITSAVVGGFLALGGSVWTSRREAARSYRFQLFNALMPPLIAELAFMPARETPELDEGWYDEMYGRFLRASWVAGKGEAQMARRINDLRNKRLSLEGNLFRRDSEGNYQWIGSEAERAEIDSINRDLFAMMGEYQDYLAKRIR